MYDLHDMHKKVIDRIHETYCVKNRAYGNSFGESCSEFGLIAAVIRIGDKWNRIKTLVKNKDIPESDESIKDTLLDLANYCIMAVMYIEEKENEHE